MPKPSPTTAACSRYFEIWRDSPGYGWVAIAPKASPASSASGGEAHGVRQNTRPATKSIFDRMLGGQWNVNAYSTHLNSIQPKADQGSEFALPQKTKMGPFAKER